MKELSAELIIRWWRQLAGRRKLTEVQYGMNNFNRAFFKCCGFKISTSCWLVQCRRYVGARGAVPPLTTASAPPFRFTQNTFLKHHVTTTQQIIMEQRIITLKDNSRLKFSRFFAKLLATNCCIHKCDEIIRLINTPLRMRRGIGM